MAGTVDLGGVDEVPPGKMKKFVVQGKNVLVANVDGKFYAIGSVCTHVGGPLERGRLEGAVVTCPWHGSKFDVTSGKVIGGPARNPEPAYRLEVEGKRILLET